MAEYEIWRGKPSLVLLLPEAVICLLLSWLIVPLVYLLWRVLQLQSTLYLLTTERLQIKTGFFNVRIDELELFRIRDVYITEPFWYRFFSLANLHWKTMDSSGADVTLQGICDVLGVRDKARTYIRIERQKHRVAILDNPPL